MLIALEALTAYLAIVAAARLLGAILTVFAELPLPVIVGIAAIAIVLVPMLARR